ncbi:hypothetical protein FACS189472_16210 [Alphaproteobacteria bacterium]|nr:hypothetical protein FACS189472_16210 [Alphaproteobacteria bacterium]
MKLSSDKIKGIARQGQMYAYPTQKSITRFEDQIRSKTKRTIPLNTEEIIAGLNPIIRGWGNYYRKANVRRLFLQLKGWIVRRIWSHRHKKWRNCGWKTLPESKLYRELGLVNLMSLIPSIASAKAILVKAGCGKTARPVVRPGKAGMFSEKKVFAETRVGVS